MVTAEYMGWMNWIPNRAVLDFKVRTRVPGIEIIEMDFYRFEPDEKYDVALCCQVLEHVENPKSFCEKLKTVCRHLLISVPYRWTGNAPGHIHDPVDEVKLKSWMELEPNSKNVITEPFREGRLIAYYNLEEGPKHRYSKDFIFNAIEGRARRPM
jgi:hypothetical protein